VLNRRSGAPTRPNPMRVKKEINMDMMKSTLGHIRDLLLAPALPEWSLGVDENHAEILRESLYFVILLILRI
jgi:hypothetical protein